MLVDWKKGYLILLVMTLLTTVGYLIFVFSRDYAEQSLAASEEVYLDQNQATDDEFVADSFNLRSAVPEVLEDEVPIGLNRNLIAMEKGVLDEKSEAGSLPADVFSQFEDELFAYINAELNQLIALQEQAEKEQTDDAASDKNFRTELSNIGNTGLRRIEGFKQDHKTLSAGQLKYLDEIELYINLQVLRDRLRSERLIAKMQNGHTKLSMLMSYLQTFAESEDHNVLREFALGESTWAERIEGNYSKHVNLVLFKSNPIGQSFPNHFKGVKSIENVTLSLDRFKGKIVLIDFWASWCAPCIQEFPYHKEVYYKYKDLGFDIIYVNLDTDERAFLETIEEYALPWHHVFDKNGLQGEIARNYGVERLPSSFLIDGNRRVLEVDLKGTEWRQTISNLISS
ncbi:hypothetical protein COTS27_00595 [Spirochaetota bacterium]|nr:hypothetical protein COTS27_00595 [Spirochaetota bacterium]